MILNYLKIGPILVFMSLIYIFSLFLFWISVPKVLHFGMNI